MKNYWKQVYRENVIALKLVLFPLVPNSVEIATTICFSLWETSYRSLLK